MGFPERKTIARPAMRLDELPTRLVVTYQTTYANEIKIFNIEYVPYLFKKLLINLKHISTKGLTADYSLKLKCGILMGMNS